MVNACGGGGLRSIAPVPHELRACLEPDADVAAYGLRLNEEAEGVGELERDGETRQGDGALDGFPERPYVPPLLVCMAAVMVVQNLALRGFVRSGVLVGILAGNLVAVLVACGAARGLGVWGRLGRLCAYAACVLACALAAAFGAALKLAQIDAQAEAMGTRPISALVFSVESDPSQTSTGWLCRASATFEGKDVAVVWLTVPEQPTYGDTLRCIGRFQPNANDEWGQSSRSRGICGRVRATRVQEREAATGVLCFLVRLRAWALGAIDPARSEARALMAGVLVADRGELKAQGVEERFSAVGLSHLVAVSGSHLVVVGASLEALLLALGARPVWRRLGVLGISGAYVVFCASPSSAVRSWVMLAASFAGKSLGRRYHAPSGMALAGLCMCAADPCCACDLGFVLSVLSVCALALFASHMEAILRLLLPHVRAPRGMPPFAWRLWVRVGRAVDGSLSTLAASLVCQLATLPACAVTFGTVSVLAPVANVVVGPIFGPLVSVGVVAVAISWVPVVGPALMAAVELGCAVAVGLTDALASVPFASVPVALGAAWELAPLAFAALMLAWWPRPRKGQLVAALACAGVACAAWLVGTCVLVPAQLMVLDVGQGDAILVREGPHSVLVDTGPADEVIGALARNHVFALDAIVITHLHDDHTGGLDDILGTLPVGCVYVAEGVSTGLSRELEELLGRTRAGEALELCVGDALTLGGFELTCLWPREAVDGSHNEDSLCLGLSYEAGERTLTALLTGDAEQDVLAEVAPAAGDIDLLKVGHHGSRVSLSPDEARTLAPEVAVASAGADNSYGHPTPECVRVLEDAGANFLCTKDVGDVRAEPGAEGVRVSVQRGDAQALG